MSEDMLDTLDHISKLSRFLDFLGTLLKEGDEQGSEFYKDLESTGVKVRSRGNLDDVAPALSI